jgi:hypothetical protein
MRLFLSTAFKTLMVEQSKKSVFVDILNDTKSETVEELPFFFSPLSFVCLSAIHFQETNAGLSHDALASLVSSPWFSRRVVFALGWGSMAQPRILTARSAGRTCRSRAALWRVAVDRLVGFSCISFENI